MSRRIAALLAVVALVGCAKASASDGQERYEAVVRCKQLAEDSAAHVRLVRFERTEDGIVLVYRCTSNGY